MKAVYQAPALQPAGSFRKATDGPKGWRCEWCSRRRRNGWNGKDKHDNDWD